MLGNPIPSLTCHLPDVPGSHNPLGERPGHQGLTSDTILELGNLVRGKEEKKEEQREKLHVAKNLKREYRNKKKYLMRNCKMKDAGTQKMRKEGENRQIYMREQKDDRNS